MEVTILAFGQIAELAGKATWKMQNIPDTDTLKNLLEDEFPSLVDITMAIAVNNILVNGKTDLNDDEIVALLPPFSGG